MSTVINIETGIKGLTPDQIQPGINTAIYGQSGRIVRLLASAEELQIRDDQYPHVRLLATLEGSTFRVDVLTKSPLFPNGKHPDFYAGRFVPFALEYFESLGLSIPYYKSLWWGNSDNYAQWIEAMKNGLSARDALNETWAGKIRSKLGFTQLIYMEVIENLKRKDSLVTSVVARS